MINASVERVEQGTALVDKAGETMTEIVSSINRVNDIMGEISAASAEQSLGIAQVGEAVSMMDKGTQQNAAMVEQMAAAASSLNSQAQDLVKVVASFKLNGNDLQSGGEFRSGKTAIAFNGGRKFAKQAALQSTRKPESKPLPKGKVPVLSKQVTGPSIVAKSSGSDDDWETF